MTKQPFIVHCVECTHEWAPFFLPIEANVMSKLLAKVKTCGVCGSGHVLLGPKPKPTIEGDPMAWLGNGDTGISSMTIWHRMMNRPAPADFRSGHPHDPADFGRCYRLLKVMPSWRSRIDEMKAESDVWSRLSEAWSELESIYEAELPSGKCPRLYARMQQLIEARAQS